MPGWQMVCCGTHFREAGAVSWRLRHPNSAELAWFDTVLHDGVAARIDAVEDHHGDSSAPLTEGTVTSIFTLHCRFSPEPVAESGLLTSVVTAEKWNEDLDDRHFAGFLISVLAPKSIRVQGRFSTSSSAGGDARRSVGVFTL
ncbi:DUF6578 domain-containing protein [Paractinoplanes brasiliensis]|nr:DUF6578 domain-containing protein [Actinoplanes brasiliensis]